MTADFEATLRLPLAQRVLGHQISLDEDSPPFVPGVLSRIEFLLRNPENISPLAEIGNAALDAFLQSNVTGPPLSFDSSEVIIPKSYNISDSSISQLRKQLFQGLIVDGEAVYDLIPNIELFWFAKCIHNHKTVADLPNGRRQRARTNFVHQRLLFESSDTLQKSILADLKAEEASYLESKADPKVAADFLSERAAIYIFYGLDAEARTDLSLAAKIRQFEFALTGRLGRRTKFQQFDLSQLVVLARSANDVDISSTDQSSQNGVNGAEQSKPDNIALNDDTLLESIKFTKDESAANLPSIEDSSSLPASLASMDPETQTLLAPQDSIILLSIASSITNTSPADGLTREETLPYALRVLEGGSSNWQVYTQALLVRSRIEGYNSRTTERGLLQLQALVDQVIADTTSNTNGSTETPATFLPKPKAEDSANPEERLKYIHSLSTPFRWTLEAELASRWISMGGLRSALEIYERLQMWSEVALCLAATDQEKKAITVVRKLLYQPGQSGEEDDFSGPDLSELPADSPRLFCILGDLESDNAVQHYTRAWDISQSHYARAQRSLARLYSKQKSYDLAIEAYQKTLKVTRTNASIWFSMGCVQLEIEDYPGAAESFTQMVQLEETDAEGWSNLAVALLRMPVPEEPSDSNTENQPLPDEEEDTTSTTPTPKQTKTLKIYQNRLSALQALSRATSLKPTDSRLWDNYLTVASSLPLSATPWSQIVLAQRKILTLRPSESSIDLPILSRLTSHILSLPYPPSISKPMGPGSLESQFLSMIDTEVIPQITTSPHLWTLVSKVYQWRSRPSAALEAAEKAWRITTNKPAIYETEAGFNEIVDATTTLVAAYREFGPLPKEGLASSSTNGESTADDAPVEEGALVCKTYKFKARSAVRSVIGKGKDYWEDSEGMEKLRALLSEE